MRLRPFRPDDFQCLQEYALRECFWRFLPLERQTPDSVRLFLDKRLEEEWGVDGYHCAVELIDEQRLIGTVRIAVKDAKNCSGDVGYALNEFFWGEGYMTEAVQKILQVGFNELCLQRIWATADVANTASWRLMERVGMQREGRLRQHKKNRQ
ncbi:GNAT family N-acetyltransferase [uncultured Tateyamaria sp.]|uniref:GNAT family N-acetyltransferase n=1 Tax=uncultured Tateyamaria sp. TaxID=455651 RepID=UPI00344C146D